MSWNLLDVLERFRRTRAGARSPRQERERCDQWAWRRRAPQIAGWLVGAMSGQHFVNGSIKGSCRIRPLIVDDAQRCVCGLCRRMHGVLATRQGAERFLARFARVITWKNRKTGERFTGLFASHAEIAQVAGCSVWQVPHFMELLRREELVQIVPVFSTRGRKVRDGRDLECPRLRNLYRPGRRLLELLGLRGRRMARDQQRRRRVRPAVGAPSHLHRKVSCATALEGQKRSSDLHHARRPKRDHELATAAHDRRTGESERRAQRAAVDQERQAAPPAPPKAAGDDGGSARAAPGAEHVAFAPERHSGATDSPTPTDAAGWFAALLRVASDPARLGDVIGTDAAAVHHAEVTAENERAAARLFERSSSSSSSPSSAAAPAKRCAGGHESPEAHRRCPACQEHRARPVGLGGLLGRKP
jgi:hypothetical protein